MVHSNEHMLSSLYLLRRNESFSLGTEPCGRTDLGDVSGNAGVCMKSFSSDEWSEYTVCGSLQKVPHSRRSEHGDRKPRA